VRFQSVRITQEDLEAGAEWSDLGLEASERPVFIAVADPFSIDIRSFVDGVASAFPGAPILGGLASAAHRPGQNQILLNDELHEDGLVAVALTGNVEVDTVVSQGCRPIGKPFIVTKGEGNIVRALRNLTAMDALREIAGTLSNEEQELMQHGLFLGRAIDEYKSHYGRGDFLIQNVIGADPKSGAIAVNGEVKVGTTVQFHVRDHVSADEDLRNLLQGRMGFAGAPPEGALLFSCNGRGTRMWDEPGHDVGVLREAHAGLPVAGFFCAGEIGPVGGQNFIHGFTASIGLFRPKE
jgi:small ligand-binding sensory domain FIST